MRLSYPFEIQSMKLIYKPVVVLSACQSGLGKVMEAGIVGVARGFPESRIALRNHELMEC